jgi:hypothetical protein
MSIVNRGRDVLDLMKKKGELGVREAIVKLAEDNTMLHHELKETQDVLRSVVQQLAMQLGLMKEQQKLVTTIQQKYYPDNEANPDKQWS